MSRKNRVEQPQRQAGEKDASAGRFADYFWVNVVFFSFLALLSYVVWMSCQAPSDDQAVKMVLADTFKFMIYLFGGGFLVVTLFDAAYDFFSQKAEAEPDSASPSQSQGQ
jgi:bacteriorhodopsin